jgi:hypothetical protein
MAKHARLIVPMPAEDTKQTEAAKTERLRALRLAKEATDREAASRKIAAELLLKSQGRQLSRSTSRVS